MCLPVSKLPAVNSVHPCTACRNAQFLVYRDESGKRKLICVNGIFTNKMIAQKDVSGMKISYTKLENISTKVLYEANLKTMNPDGRLRKEINPEYCTILPINMHFFGMYRDASP